MPVEQGVDTEEFEQFVEWLEDNPKEATLGLTATAHYDGTVGRSLAKVRGYSLGGKEIERDTREFTYPFGAWREVEDEAGFLGPTDKIEPVETTLASLAACINVAVSINALREGIDVDDFSTTVSTEVDPSVLFGVKDLDEAESCLSLVNAEIEVEGDLTDEEIERVEELAERSPVHTLVGSENTILTDVRQTG